MSSCCAYCGKERRRPDGRIRRDTRYCSTRCAGLATRRSPVERFLVKVAETENGCLLWTGATGGKSGYGKFNAEAGVGSVPMQAHRFAYECFVGPIPDGLTIDHVCRNPRCVNPAHLEPVTLGENLRRAHRARALAVSEDEVA